MEDPRLTELVGFYWCAGGRAVRAVKDLVVVHGGGRRGGHGLVRFGGPNRGRWAAGRQGVAGVARSRDGREGRPRPRCRWGRRIWRAPGGAGGGGDGSALCRRGRARRGLLVTGTVPALVPALVPAMVRTGGHAGRLAATDADEHALDAVREPVGQALHPRAAHLGVALRLATCSRSRRARQRRGMQTTNLLTTRCAKAQLRTQVRQGQARGDWTPRRRTPRTSSGAAAAGRCTLSHAVPCLACLLGSPSVPSRSRRPNMTFRTRMTHRRSPVAGGWPSSTHSVVSSTGTSSASSSGLPSGSAARRTRGAGSSSRSPSSACDPISDPNSSARSLSPAM